MGFIPYYNEMEAVRNEVYDETQNYGMRPTKSSAISDFFERAKFSVKLILLEKELITFALLQWACVGLGYYLWVQMLGWIPDAAWHRASHSDGATPADLILFLWSFFCVGIVTFPLGILSGCMGAVHFLNRQGKESTIPKCLQMVLPRAWPLWVFHWIDGWWTVMRILDRLPKKNDRRSIEEKALSEAIYYAWKTATIGILPALITGRGLIAAGKLSVKLVRQNFMAVMLLRGGYSAMCWIVGIAAYAGSIMFFIKFPHLVNWKLSTGATIHAFYFWVGIPLMVAVGVVMVILRPIYIISACDIYANFIAQEKEGLMVPEPPQNSQGSTALTVAALLCLAMVGVIMFRDQLGITALLSR